MKKLIFIALLISLASIAGADRYQRTGVIFQSDMGASAASDFSVVQTPDATAEFGVDVSAIPVAPNYTGGGTSLASIGFTTIPDAPNGDNIALRLEVNNTDDATDYEEGLCVYADISPATENYDIEFDFFMAFTLPLVGGGAGSTEHFGMSVLSSGTKLNCIRDWCFDNANPANTISGSAAITDFDGLNFGGTGDTGELFSDLFCLDPFARIGVNSSSANGQVGVWQAAEDAIRPATLGDREVTNIDDANYTNYYYDAMVFNATRVANNDDYAPGWQWNTMTAEVRGQTVNFKINGVSFVIADSTSTLDKIGIICTDPFSSVSNDNASDPRAESFMLIDNFTIYSVKLPLITGLEQKEWSEYR